MITVQERLARWLREHDRTASELAREVRVDRSYIAHLLAGRCLPGLRVAVRIERLTHGAVRAVDWIPAEEAAA